LLFEALRLGTCRLCESVFEIGAQEGSNWSNLSRTLKKAIIDEKGLMFWNYELAERKRKLAAAVKRHYKRIRSQQLPKKLY